MLAQCTGSKSIAAPTPRVTELGTVPNSVRTQLARL